MGLKCIRFTNGNWLPIYANSTSIFDDTVHCSDYTLITYGLYNAAITAGNPEPGGGFVNPNLSGETMTDLDGNVWSFNQTDGDTMVMTITTPGGLVTTRNLDRAYASNSRSSWIYYLKATAIDADGNYEIQLHKARPVLENSEHTYYFCWLRRGYINGYNENSGTIMSSDTYLIHPGENKWTEYGEVFSHLRNVVPGSPFINVVGHYLCSKGDNDVKAEDFYLGPLSAGQGMGVILNLKDSIDDIPEDLPDPFEPGGSTEPGGGTGNLDDTSDPVPIPSLPTLSAVDTGFITLYNPSLAELQSLANYMWNTLDISTLRKIFADPMETILGLSIVPVAVPNGGVFPVTVGNIPTGISMNRAASQYVEVDCGSITINEYWGAYLDYSPFTSAELYLPYIGAHAINIDDIMGKTVTVKYHVDILTGACTAFVKCGDSVLYEFIGQCSSSIPVSGGDMTNVVNGIIHIAGAIGTMVATSGASVPATIAEGVSIASTAMNMKPSIEKSGSMSGTGGMLGVQKPYIILTRPKQAVPSSQNSFTGYPSFITTQLGSITGYTEVEKIHLSGISATAEELEEIEQLLYTGVIL